MCLIFDFAPASTRRHVWAVIFSAVEQNFRPSMVIKATMYISQATAPLVFGHAPWQVGAKIGSKLPAFSLSSCQKSFERRKNTSEGRNWGHEPHKLDACLALNVIGLSSTWLRTRWRASKSRSTWWSPWATTSTTRTPASTTGTWTRQCPRFLSC